MPEGTPIGHLYPDKPAVEATLRASGVFTVEQCADLSGHAIDNIGMGTQRWVNDAKKFLDFANKGVKAAQFRAEMDEKDREIKVLHQQVSQLTASLEQLRTQSLAQADLGTIQAMIAGAMARPQHMPGKGFDPQLAQINAASPAAQPVRRRRPTLG
jgi:multidrug resistance efflux pump